MTTKSLATKRRNDDNGDPDPDDLPMPGPQGPYDL